MPKPTLHSPRDTYWNVGQLSAELGCVELAMRACQVTNVVSISRMCAALHNCCTLWRIELE